MRSWKYIIKWRGKKAVNTAVAVVIVQLWHKGSLNLYSKLCRGGSTSISSTNWSRFSYQSRDPHLVTTALMLCCHPLPWQCLMFWNCPRNVSLQDLTLCESCSGCGAKSLEGQQEEVNGLCTRTSTGSSKTRPCSKKRQLEATWRGNTEQRCQK